MPLKIVKGKTKVQIGNYEMVMMITPNEKIKEHARKKKMR